MKPTGSVPFWRNWGFWGIVLLVSHLPIPYNPISIVLALVAPWFYFGMIGQWLQVVGLILVIFGLWFHPKNRGWSLAGLTIAVFYVITVLVILQRLG